jgi:tight adherence protein C
MSPIELSVTVAGLLAMAVFIVVLAVSRHLHISSTFHRLGQVVHVRPDDTEASDSAVKTLDEIELSKPFAQRVIMPALHSTLRVVGRGLPGRNAEQLTLRLARAGAKPSFTVEAFQGLKLAGALATALVALAAQFVLPPLIAPPDRLMTPLWTVGAACIGFLLPELWVFDNTRKRQKKIRKALPDTLDLLAISVEAGLGFDAALNRICQKSRNPLTEVFEHYLLELRLGKPRRQALRQIFARTGVSDLNSFVSALIQADQLGVSVARVLRIQSEQLRVKRRQRAEQLAQKASLKMLFPMVMFIFPTIFVVILGPAIKQLMHMN